MRNLVLCEDVVAGIRVTLGTAYLIRPSITHWYLLCDDVRVLEDAQIRLACQYRKLEIHCSASLGMSVQVFRLANTPPGLQI